jgi:hypothetical protein
MYFNINAQIDKKRDYVWTLGYHFTPKVAFNKIDFNDKIIKLLPEITFTDTIGFNETNASICDKDGELLFYTNGIDIRGRTNRIIKNSKNFNYQQGVVVLSGGFRALQNCLILPKPQAEDTFFLFHKVTKTFYNPTRGMTDGMYITKIYAKDTFTNTIYKQRKISDDTLNYNELTAIRHTNGIDWWIMNPKDDSNVYCTFLLTHDTIQGPFYQAIGESAPYKNNFFSRATFSPDGKKFVRSRGSDDGVYIFDFDRNTGKLSNDKYQKIIGKKNDSQFSCAFSPNSQFLYIARDTFIYQYDLNVNDVFSSQINIKWDLKNDEYNFSTKFGTLILGPDCRIYGTTSGTTRYMHVIDKPNLKGENCNVIQRGLKMPTHIAWGVPNFPNFRLGAISENFAPCDSTKQLMFNTATEDTPQDAVHLIVNVYPNPASQDVNVDLYGFVQSFTQGIWQLCDATGQQVATYPILSGHSEYQFVLPELPNGIYFWRLVLDGNIRGNGKLVVLK